MSHPSLGHTEEVVIGICLNDEIVIGAIYRVAPNLISLSNSFYWSFV
jgi:hypothetical protein